MACGSPDSVHLEYSCEQPCPKQLACGNHICELPCHPGDCRQCMREPSLVKTCPCGRTRLSALGAAPRLSCADPIPTCTSECRKRLACGHACPLRCHDSPCPPCQKVVRRSCICGRSKQEITCAEASRGEYTCQRVCQARLRCGQHKCSVVCCPARQLPPEIADELHACMQECGKRLPCGCTCGLICHGRQPCPPCGRTLREPLSCHCGRTAIPPPIRCGTAPPQCHYPCSRPQACGHAVTHTCHPEPECPPCGEVVYRPCVGGHRQDVRTFCYTKEVTCGATCGRALPCGDHTCPLACHAGDCAELLRKNAVLLVSSGNQNAAGRKTAERSCGMRCGKVLDCGHACILPCHPGMDCSEGRKPCVVPVVRCCACGTLRKQVPCNFGKELGFLGWRVQRKEGARADEQVRRLQGAATDKWAAVFCEVAGSHPSA